MKWGTWARGLALGLAILALVGAGGEGIAETRGVTIKLKASEAAGAPVAEEVRLYGSSHALVIGIDAYRDRAWPRLSQPISDARAVARVLEAQGFEVTVATNLDADSLLKTLRDFFIRKGRDSQSRLFVWFAGHGHTLNGEGFLIPADGASPSDEIAFLSTAVSLRDFGKFVRYANSKHVYAVFDACFAGTIFNVARSRTPPAITRVTTEPVRQFLSSGDAGQQVSDDGRFARMFVEALEGRRRADANGDGYLTASEIGSYLTYRVANLSNNRQTPRHGKLASDQFDKGDFVFVLPESRADTATATGARREADAAVWSAIQNSTDAADFTIFIETYPASPFVPFAEARLKRLQSSQVAALTPGIEISEMDAPHMAVKVANLRAGPNTEAARVGRLGIGEAVLVTGRVKGRDWLRIAHAGKTAYVWAPLLTEVDAAELAAWNRIKDSREAADMEAFVKAHPEGHFAPRARRLLAALRPAPRPSPPTPSESAPSPPAGTESVPAPPAKKEPAVGTYFQPGQTFRDCADCPEMVVIPPGSFRMGDQNGVGFDTERPVHDVRIDYRFAVGKYEVTRGQFADFVRETGHSVSDGCYVFSRKAMRVEPGRGWRDPGYSQTDDHPVACVNWQDAKAYVSWLSGKTGQEYRLLSEAEWEYVARAGSQTKYGFGNAESELCAHGNAADRSTGLDWRNKSCSDGVGKSTAPVGRYAANGFGLYDMIGNVWEWTEDCATDTYQGAPTDGGAWTSGSCNRRAVRGGSWMSDPRLLRSAYRGRVVHHYRLGANGFRVARSIP